MLIPLVDGGRALGLVAAVSYSPEPPSVEFLGDLALPLALALARHELHQKTLDVAAELERRNEVLRRQAEELREQGNQLLLQSKDLEQKNREVARADQMKSEFLANMSHELRTPLNAVIGFSELLLSDRQHRLEGDQRRFVQDIHTSGRHLLELITDLLDLAKIESGGTTLHQSSISALDAIDAAVELLTPAAEQKHLEITNHATPDLFTNADPAKLRQVLLNLGSNAVKFSAEGGPIDFGAERQDGTVRFFVRDAGPGIDDSLMPRLFTPFVQGESAFVKRHQGTGLGLAISRRIVEAHGGTIGVETKPGQGSTFWFTLPIGVAPLDVVRAKPEAITPPHAPSSMPLIVVIEDDPATQRLIEAYLTRGGYRISMCERADGAAALVDELQPAAVLLDLNLHGQDGLLVLAELKKNPSTRTIPVVIESVFADKQHGLVLGAEAHLTKPFDRNALLDRLAQLVRVRTGEPTRVLLIDDDPAVGEILRPMLKTAGYELLVAVEGTEGIAVAAAEKPALAIVDLMLPDMSGLDVIDALAADPRSSQLPVLVLTGADLTEEERSRLLKRVNALAQKSDFSADTLLDAIGRAVGKKAEPAPQVKGPRILVVDDHDLNRELVRAILEQANYEVLEAEDGEDGGRVARRERPELILLDLAMPKKSGYEML
ncbi:MAG: response regulator, partial [Deltaproteobacteria bacterium]|nr:response regulator [Deltaproteobacteria bacterium]